MSVNDVSPSIEILGRGITSVMRMRGWHTRRVWCSFGSPSPFRLSLAISSDLGWRLELRALLGKEEHLPIAPEQFPECKAHAWTLRKHPAFRTLLMRKGQVAFPPQQHSELRMHELSTCTVLLWKVHSACTTSSHIHRAGGDALGSHTRWH